MTTKITAIALLFIFTFSYGAINAQQKEAVKHTFKALPYAYEALEKSIDKETMEIHYDRHHRAYFNNFNKAIEGTEMATLSFEELFANMSKYPVSVRNNGGGHFNHDLFWSILSPNGGGEPSGDLAKAINETFGSFADFKKKFEAAGATRFGSGWAWLSIDANGQLFVNSTPNQDNPLMDVVDQRGTPIFGIDVWEHAYYLRYQNKRASYMQAFWDVVNWKEVEHRYAAATKK
jgi:Fe-Mn family superoxide dismutase